MVAQNTVRTYGINQIFRFVEGIWLHRKTRQTRRKFQEKTILHYTCATYSELPSNIRTMTTTKCIFICQTDFPRHEFRLNFKSKYLSLCLYLSFPLFLSFILSLCLSALRHSMSKSILYVQYIKLDKIGNYFLDI